MNFLEKAGLLMFLSGLVSISHLASKAGGMEQFSIGGTVAIVIFVIGGILFFSGS